MLQRVRESSDYIRRRIKGNPEIAIVLGTGLGDFGDRIRDKIEIPYADIPNFPISTVEGHRGCLLFGELEGKYVMAMQGRFHYYEGYEMSEVTFPIRVICELGCKKLVLTNASGGVNINLRPGDLMLVEDHINPSGISPLRGKNMDEYGPRFPDVSDLYSKQFNGRILVEASEMGIRLALGVYCYMPGPQFETAAEIRMARTLGADVVGMSTVPEAIVAAHMGMRVTGISCVTNMGTGVLDGPIDHAGVNEVAKNAEEAFSQLLCKIVEVS